MANRADLDLARRLLGDRVVSEDRIREALKIQADYLEKGRSVTLEQVLYARGDVPKGSLAPVSAPPLVESQPFENYRPEQTWSSVGVK